MQSAPVLPMPSLVDDVASHSERQSKTRTKEWVRRYLPCEIVGTVAELGGGLLVYVCTGSFTAAATAAAVFSSIGYYAIAYYKAVRYSSRNLDGHNGISRFAKVNVLALRSVAVEFGPAEVIDLVLARPAAFYLSMVVTDNAVAGLIIGKVLADIAFYTCTIFSYEKFRRLVAHDQSVNS